MLKLRVDELARVFCGVIVTDPFVNTVLARYVYAFSGSRIRWSPTTRTIIETDVGAENVTSQTALCFVVFDGFAVFVLVCVSQAFQDQLLSGVGVRSVIEADKLLCCDEFFSERGRTHGIDFSVSLP